MILRFYRVKQFFNNFSTAKVTSDSEKNLKKQEISIFFAKKTFFVSIYKKSPVQSMHRAVITFARGLFTVFRNFLYNLGNIGVVNHSVELLGTCANGKEGHEACRVIGACP